ncbi:winged helix DNA-binding domain-containing protein [Streptomyces sp. NBC_01142]|uniref:winged helix DNA-binding domain-containing protein n=1 Tax=Streptomyces sp. NBC_01142 TaxID=2975865 RepID=UPI00225749FB|nr:winged helix DNA-binding domain-containing protein [Streptomyces sp. NBC_01142]MCX4819091.1 winged helix DNA-binding domain-containing protein [Streptomyces sp. NBC_01142]
MTTRTVTWTQANARRLMRQGLAAPAERSPAEITGAMLGAHAQVLSAAEASVALRLAGGSTRSDVREALWTDSSLVKTYGPRGTVHLLPAADLPMWTGALSAIPAGPNTMPAGLRLTGEQTDQIVAAVGDALADAELTIDELTEAIVERTGPWARDPGFEAFQGEWPRWRQSMHTAAHRGVLRFAPNRGRRATYTSPGVTPMDGPAALDELVHRYVYAYGPATPQHFAKWLAAPKGWAAGLFASLTSEGRIEEVAFEGGPAWVAAGDTAFGEEPARGVRLLPYFDAYIIASQPRELLFPGDAYERALAGGQAGNFPVVLVDGTVAGVWHQRRSGRRIAVTVEPIGGALSTAARRRELERQVERLGEVLEAKPELTVGKVTVGAHA